MSSTEAEHALIACHECDLLLRQQTLPPGAKAICPRCGALLHQHKPNSIERALNLTLACLIFYVLTNVYPLLTFELQGREQRSTLFTGVVEMYRQDLQLLAGLVFLVGILAPLLKILGLLYVLLPLRLGRLPWRLATVFRSATLLHPWAMLEVYLLGVLVAFVKLSSMATLIPGIAMFSLVALIFSMAAADAALDPHLIWAQLDRKFTHKT